MTQVIAVLGAGTMGSGIAVSCLSAGLPVTLIDSQPAALERAGALISAHFRRQVETGRLAEPEALRFQSGLTLSQALADLAPATVVIEAVFEDPDVKHALLTEVEPLIAPDTVIATNTSCLLVADLARALRHPERFLGLHYFSPAAVNPVVELIRTAQTNARSAEMAADLLRRTGKEALLCRDSNGFAINRFFCPYCNEATRLTGEGLATPGQVDAVARETFGLALGPFAVMNLTHPRIMLHAQQSLTRFGAFYTPSPALTAIGAQGTLWEIEAEPEPLAADTARQVAERLQAAILLVVGEVVAEGVVSADDLDRGARLALRFGTPPGALRESLGEAEAARLVAALYKRHPKESLSHA
ncbi:3-hydroxyacyl-CoA dehydrogenase family protein [Rhodobacter sp. 24-YEA-8]|uniref:3-hydroxyacyl-CoA dehydrogenase family protein n=1 Tax=Rhodobacter sp. 24-YEA-8 TaxID=1884310 RepID=UPI00089813CE|nr:3-hydroxyacyl-CoA dehydrogenase family protein [Rhodobacter sp. 24-YEA-8]SED16286.1 3-hydroxybutyryl-CoA dehydrogenase [Rhodobacter sp. 24-YEA-8]